MTKHNGITIKNIFYMLTYAFQQLGQGNYESIDEEPFDDAYDLFAEILIRGVSYQLKQGLHKEYVAKHDTLATLRGKLDLQGTIRNKLQRRLKVDCDYDELSENNLFNQILKSTLLLLRGCEQVKRERRIRLQQLLFFFSTVDTIDLKRVAWTKLRFDRNSQSYQMLLYICYFVTEGLLMTTEEGKYKMHTFDDEWMSRLFEKFILEYYKRHHSQLKARAAQVDWNIEISQSSMDILPIMQTDVLLTFPHRTLIIDAKYYSKSMQDYFGKKKIHSHNFYQIQSYVMNLDKTHSGTVDGMLLYAKTDEDITPDGQAAFSDGNMIYFRTLDLNKDFDEIKAQLDGFLE